nr:MAG TPA: hypothetical protein [Caudoviricetes sp.]
MISICYHRNDDDLILHFEVQQFKSTTVKFNQRVF